MDITTQHLYHRLRPHATLNNVVLLAAAGIVLIGVWNTIATLQKNFLLQQRVDSLDQQIEIARLETETARLQQQYLRSPEYIELVARKSLGKAAPGEVMVVLPPTPAEPSSKQPAQHAAVARSNPQLWIDFFFGSRR